MTSKAKIESQPTSNARPVELQFVSSQKVIVGHCKKKKGSPPPPPPPPQKKKKMNGKEVVCAKSCPVALTIM